MKLPITQIMKIINKGGDITEAVGSTISALEVNKETTTTTTDTRDNLNVRPGIKFEPGRAEVWGYSQTTFSVPPLVHDRSDLHLDHRKDTIKGAKHPNPSGYNKEKPTEAIKKWAKCETTCCACHDQGENLGGKKRAKMKTKTKM